MSKEFPPRKFTIVSLNDKRLLRQIIQSGNDEDNLIACNQNFLNPTPNDYAQKSRKISFTVVRGECDLDL